MRSYHQYCALARALDLVGDRWSLLIVRNLILGPQRWSQLRSDLPGIATNLLSSRLAELETKGIIVADDEGYSLTQRGAELERSLFALADWGERHAPEPPRPGEALRLRYLMTSLRRRLGPGLVSGVVGLHIDGETYWVALGAGPRLEQGTVDAEAEVYTTLSGFRALLFDGIGSAQLAREGRIALSGDPALVDAFVAAVRPAR